MSLPRYPKYKDSGVEWLGEVPEHWEVGRLKRACNVFPSNVDKKSYEDETPVLLCNYTDVYYNDTIAAEMDLMAATASADQIAKFTLRAGDTIITKDSETADDIAISAYVPRDLPGVVCGYHLSVVRPAPGVHGAFVKRLFDSVYAKSCFAVRANGLTRVGLGQYELDNVELPFPPAREQALIAEFLDCETAKIDALVAEQQRLIELLAEKRQAVISHTVTKGLNPNASTRDSGIEWLGAVPAHWQVVRLRRLGRIDQGNAFSHSIQGDEVGDLPWFKVGDMNRPGNEVEMRQASNYVSSAIAHEERATIFPAGTTIFPRVGAALLTNKRRMLSEAAIIDDNVFGFIPADIEPRFAYLALLLLDMAKICSAGLVPTITFSVINDYTVAVPPRQEQLRIVAYVESACGKIDALTAEAERAIDLLQERRTALISAAVTGQIDVRPASTRRSA